MADPGGAEKTLSSRYSRSTSTVTSSSSASAPVQEQLERLPAVPTNNVISPSNRPEDELRLLRDQNRALATALQKFHPLPKSEQIALANKLDSAEGTQEFLAKIQAYFDSPNFLTSLDARRCSYVVPSEYHEDQVGVVDLDDIEWWTLVPSEHPESSVEEESLDGGFVWVEESDVVAGIADTITDVVRRIPAAQKLDNSKLQQLLSGTFSELREKSLTGKLWQYGTLAMSICSWGSYGLSLYRDPSTVLWVMRTLYSVLKYACLLVII